MNKTMTKVSEKTLIDKIFKGIEDNGWTVLNGLGSGNYNAAATRKSMVAPLVEYLKT